MIYQNKAEAIIIDFIKGAVADRPLSPEEDDELQALINHLNVRPRWDERTQAELVKYRLFWQIENEALPQLFVSFSLRPQEACRFLCDALWQEAIGSNHAYPVVQPDVLRHKLANGTYWRNTQSDTLPLAADGWKPTGPGTLYLTNQQLIFRTTNLELRIHLNTVADFDHHPNGIFVHRKKGEPIFLAMPNGADIFAMILGRTLREL